MSKNNVGVFSFGKKDEKFSPSLATRLHIIFSGALVSARLGIELWLSRG